MSHLGVKLVAELLCVGDGNDVGKVCDFGVARALLAYVYAVLCEMSTLGHDSIQFLNTSVVARSAVGHFTCVKRYTGVFLRFRVWL